jgi:hypothetical protein
MMPAYVEAGTQTEWAGLMQCTLVRPEILLSAPHNTTTPPDDMLTEKAQFIHGYPAIASPPHILQATPPMASLLERRQNRTLLNPHIPLPAKMASHELNDDVPLSPTTTHALLSPLPEANRLHAGHTPLIPRALSPAMEVPAAPLEQAHAPADDKAATPDADEGLTGALTLPTNPVDGADDGHIPLNKLDAVLSKISRQQAELRGEFPDEPAKITSPTVNVTEMPSEEGMPLSRKGSADSHRSGMTEEVDGVILKTPPSNFGAPFGSLGW